MLNNTLLNAVVVSAANSTIFSNFMCDPKSMKLANVLTCDTRIVLEMLR